MTLNKVDISSRRWLLLPIEIKARELMSKTLLACHAAEQGWGVVVGSKDMIRSQQALLPKGVLLEKDADPTHEGLVDLAQSSGNRLSVMDEEGLVEYGRDDYIKKRVSKYYFESLDYFFTWGDQQARWLESLEEEVTGRVVRSGNPRFDLLRPEHRTVFQGAAAEIQQKYGNVILFNTNFGKFNTNMGRNWVRHMKLTGKLADAESERFYTEATAFEEKHLREFLAVVPEVAERYSNHTIVLRPHPSESHAPWHDAVRRHANLHVIYEGNVHEWIMAADVVVHINCTTGVEAFLLGKPTIAYRVNKDERFDFPVTYELSAQASTRTELLSLLDRYVDGVRQSAPQGSAEEKNRTAEKYIAGMQGQLAVESIIEALERLDLPNCSAGFPIRPDRTPFGTRLRYKLKQALKPMRVSDTKSMAPISGDYTRRKFPGIEIDEIQEIVEKLRRTTSRNSDIHVAEVFKDTFCLYT